MGLIPNPPGRIVGGEILFRTNAKARWSISRELPIKALRKLRGARHRDDLPGAHDEPGPGVYRRRPDRGSCGAASRHESRQAARKRALDMLELVEIPAAKTAYQTNIRINCPAACGSG